MTTIEIDAVVDEDGRLVLNGPIPLAPGRVRIRVHAIEGGEDDVDEEEVFRSLVQHGWADVLNDPAEDVYTLADGLPIDPVTGDVIGDGTR